MPAIAPAILFSYNVGDHIEQLDQGRPRRWRPAVIMSLAPYRGAPGYYTLWTDANGRLPTDAVSSSGGWTYESNMRRPLVELAGMSIAATYEPLHFTSHRGFDWHAVDDATYDGSEDAGCPIGRGATEAEAIADLIIESQHFHDQADRDAAWQYRLNCMIENCDSSPIVLSAFKLTLPVGSAPAAIPIGH